MRASRKPGLPIAAGVAGILLGASVCGIAVVGAPKALQTLFEPKVGDVLHITSQIGMGERPSMDVPAVVVSGPAAGAGTKCMLGVGDAAAEGGTLVIVRYDPAEGYVASWAGPGRSSRVGQDCGHAAELRLSADDARAIELAPFLVSLFPTTN